MITDSYSFNRILPFALILRDQKVIIICIYILQGTILNTYVNFTLR